MNSDSTAILVLAGVAGGLINALAGGATLITFPAMLAAGLPAITANASNAVAISPGHLIAALADHAKLPGWTKRTIAFAAVALLGGVIGATVLLLLPERLFVLPVPALIAFATLLFLFAPRIQAWSARRQGFGGPPSARLSAAILGLALRQVPITCQRGRALLVQFQSVSREKLVDTGEERF